MIWYKKKKKSKPLIYVWKIKILRIVENNYLRARFPVLRTLAKVIQTVLGIEKSMCS